MAILDRCKAALQIAADVTAYDTDVENLIAAARLDLSIAGVVDPVDHKDTTKDDDPLIQRAVITYCRMNFGSPSDYDRLKSSYDEQKKQLMMATGYTEWGDSSVI